MNTVTISPSAVVVLFLYPKYTVEMYIGQKDIDRTINNNDF